MMAEPVLSVDRFMADVKMIVERDLSNSFEDLKKDILQISKSKGLSSSQHKQIQQSVHQLLKRIKKHSKQNMHKFELYALQNIFPAENAISARTQQQAHHRPPSDIGERDQQLQSISPELLALRHRYATLTQQNSLLRQEAEASEVLLKQMTKSIFDLRVGAQALDSYDVRPLEDTVGGVMGLHEDLRALHSQAKDLTNNLKHSCGEGSQSPAAAGCGGDSAAMSFSPDGEEGDIDTIDAEDIRQLNDLLK